LKIVIDTNVLVQIMQNEGAKDLLDPETGQLVASAFERAEALVDRIDALNGVVLLPAPVVSEYLLGIDRKSYQAHLTSSMDLSA
jgi:predicted nucleic acid-binding protein